METNDTHREDPRNGNEKPRKQWDEKPGEKPTDPRQQQIERKREETEEENQNSSPDPVGNRENQKENQRNQEDPVRKGENWEEGEEK